MMMSSNPYDTHFGIVINCSKFHVCILSSFGIVELEMAVKCKMASCIASSSVWGMVSLN